MVVFNFSNKLKFKNKRKTMAEPLKYRANLKEIKVPLQKLLLDPNNPRFMEDHDVRIEEVEWADSGVQTQTAKRMSEGGYHLNELKKSVVSNGWQPVDMIFVRKVDGLPDHYVVLEGNRRVTALRELQAENKLPTDVIEVVKNLPVLEVLGTAADSEIKAQISYLLGVRHHGSLKPWGPFAQAHDLYERYLRLSGMNDQNFEWNEKISEDISAQLSLDPKKIKERIRVYRAMKQLNEVPKIARIGIEGRYYSLVKDALPTSPSSPLSQYLRQDSNTFRLDELAVERFDQLCHFSTSGRKNAPIKNPDEWKPLSNILKDIDEDKKNQMLNAVLNEKQEPTVVFAERQAELRQLRWDIWLTQVTALLGGLKMANVDPDDPEAQSAVSKLAVILDALPAGSSIGRNHA
jgi:hypothetical protein